MYHLHDNNIAMCGMYVTFDSKNYHFDKKVFPSSALKLILNNELIRIVVGCLCFAQGLCH